MEDDTLDSSICDVHKPVLDNEDATKNSAWEEYWVPLQRGM